MPVRESRNRSNGEPILASGEGLSRVFRAPRSLVFEVWTKAEHFARWYGPHGAEVFGCELDPRPGGMVRFGHRSRDGMALHLKGSFSEVVRDERIVFAVGFVDEHGQPVPHPMFPDWPLDVTIEVSVTLADAGDGTRVTLGHRVLPPHLESHAATKRWSPLALEGSKQVLERLGEHLEHLPPAVA